ncbi:zinc ribbon domain-containing protein [Candidatus Kaiserbacteria bacterium]|nr:zinc ribbon domain-containing protein [Candidatus Kaiserbacteria bacterium]
MALIICSECGKEISEKATTCPRCGNPINNLVTVENLQPVTTIEQTSKKWKKVTVFS